MRSGWGRDNPAYRQIFASSFIPGAGWEQMRWFNDLCRTSASPENAVRFRRTSGEIDVTELLPRVKVPTLVLHARGDMRVSFDQGRVLAAGIPGARFVPLEGSNHILLEDEPAWTVLLREVRRFLGVSGQDQPASREFTKTILFTDVEGSTELMQTLGDERARALLREHEKVVREALGAHGGTEIKTMGDGFMVSFPSATRAIECAISIQKALNPRRDELPLKVRIGLHAGEPLVEGEDLYGSAVNMAARITGEARGGEILVSDVVRQLVAGKGFDLAERGPVTLHGFAQPVTVCEVVWQQ
jgi:class 3 adenylate cyclase